MLGKIDNKEVFNRHGKIMIRFELSVLRFLSIIRIMKKIQVGIKEEKRIKKLERFMVFAVRSQQGEAKDCLLCIITVECNDLSCDEKRELLEYYQR